MTREEKKRKPQEPVSRKEKETNGAFQNDTQTRMDGEKQNQSAERHRERLKKDRPGERERKREPESRGGASHFRASPIGFLLTRFTA